MAYADLVRDPITMMCNIHDRLDWPPEPAAIVDMGPWLSAQEERRHRKTRHNYSLADYLLTREAVNRAFEPYLGFASDRELPHFLEWSEYEARPSPPPASSM